MEENDCLDVVCRGEDFSQGVKAESEQRPSFAPVFFDRDRIQSRHRHAGFDRQRNGQR